MRCFFCSRAEFHPQQASLPDSPERVHANAVAAARAGAAKSAALKAAPKSQLQFYRAQQDQEVDAGQEDSHDARWRKIIIY